MNHIWSLRDYKIIHEGSGYGEGLSSDSSSTGRQVVGPHVGDQSLQGPDEGRFAYGPVDFTESCFPMLLRHQPEAPIGENLPQIADIDVRLPIAFSGKCKNSIWTCFNVSVDRPCEMNSKKGKSGIRNGVNQPLNERSPSWDDCVIFTAEGNDSDIRPFGYVRSARPVRYLCDAIDEEACTVYRILGSELSTKGFYDEPIIPLHNSPYLVRGADLSP